MAQGPATATAAINPADFVSVIDNSYFPLAPGTTYITESPDGSAVGTFAVTRQTRVIDGVTCVVVSDISTVDGELSEKTSDFFAQDKAGNVWYFGEQTAEYENGKVVSTEGSWLAGIDGAQPGIIMEAAPKVGDSYDQENTPGVAEDHAVVIADNKTVNVPYGNFTGALVTNETTALEPTASEHKVYVKGIGFVQAVDQVTGEVENLVKIKIDGTLHSDSLLGKAGTDALYGHGGNDKLDGGNDKAADLLSGGSGNDILEVRTADRASGGVGNDLFHLHDNAHFGQIDGGDQRRSDLAGAKGDVLAFTGGLDLTAPDLAAHIKGIETLSMSNQNGKDTLTLNAGDVLDLGDGHFDPTLCGKDDRGAGDAVRIDGDHGDTLNLAGAWTEIEARNAPENYDVFAAHTAKGDVYVLVNENISVHIG
jgi:hypothetical protein